MDIAQNERHPATGARRARIFFSVFGVIAGAYVLLPFLAPALMAIGWSGPGKAIYFVYSFLCHQLPQRSFFLFGPKLTYPLSEIQAAWQNTNNPILLRQFIGNPQMGWKVAWSDRMVSMFSSVWLFGIFWYPLRRRLPKLPVWAAALFILPLVLDGSSHLISDFWGIGQGFRDSNLWLAGLTHQRFDTSLYAGDGWGSFNSIMRLLSGILFGLGLVWFGFPYINDSFSD
ncbi:MAG: hypothetical protein Fur0035_11160 [Anaerolineales bacterium]